jgi:two-component system, response regulator PdtaR
MDIKLKGKLTGIEATDQIRFKYNIPVIYLTAFAEKEIVELAKKNRALCFFNQTNQL